MLSAHATAGAGCGRAAAAAARSSAELMPAAELNGTLHSSSSRLQLPTSGGLMGRPTGCCLHKSSYLIRLSHLAVHSTRKRSGR